MNKTFKIGCQNTKAGHWQGKQVAELISPSAYEALVIYFTTMQEQQDALQTGRIDLSVQPAMHLALELPDDLELIALTERQVVNDVVISLNAKATLSTEHSAVGTTYALKKAFINHYYPSVSCTVESSLETCIDKLTKGDYTLVVMSEQEALMTGHKSLEYIETSYFVPCAGQGSLAVLCHKKLPFERKEILQRWVNHEETEDCIRVERAYLKSLFDTSGFYTFSYAHYEGALITLKAGVISADGKEIYKTKKSAVLGESKDLGRKVSVEVARLISEQRVQVF
jgi:hydroxymethylbilane synthase